MKRPEKKTFDELLNEGPARDFLFRAEQEMLPKMQQSAMALVIGSDHPDIKLCLEVGAALLFDKPLIIILPPGGTIPHRLRNLATVVLDDFDYAHPDADERFKQAIEATKAEIELRKK